VTDVEFEPTTIADRSSFPTPEYVFGHALIAVQMTTHGACAGLYLPLRLFVQEIAKNRVIARRTAHVTIRREARVATRVLKTLLQTEAGTLDRSVPSRRCRGGSRTENPAAGRADSRFGLGTSIQLPLRTARSAHQNTDAN
jgi:hypothetical protein